MKREAEPKNMDTQKLIGMRVQRIDSGVTGTVIAIKDGIIDIKIRDTICKFAFPTAFLQKFDVEDEDFQEKLEEMTVTPSFDVFKQDYKRALLGEIAALKESGGKRYNGFDGELISSKNDDYLYSFDTDTELHFPDGTALKILFPDRTVNAYVASIEDFTIVIRSSEYLGSNLEKIEFTSEQWLLLEALIERLDEMMPEKQSLAYEVACNGLKHIKKWSGIKVGQNQAFNRATSEKITFIWGPPGTGKTESLAYIALEHISNGRRVLMLSYSNVSVDGALLRIARKSNLPDGQILRYGYPRVAELLESKTLTSYQYVINKRKDLSREYQDLIERKRKLSKNDKERLEINKRLNRLRETILEEEKQVIQNTAFLATTVSKAIVDKAVYCQRFDVVIFDEASMAYVPQIVYSASLSKEYFVCLGDFRQLPAIAQNEKNDILMHDIFEYTGIVRAVEDDIEHEWLTMLNVQYRMHPDIAEFVNRSLYSGKLITADKIIESREEIAELYPCSGAAMALVDLSGMYSVCHRNLDYSRFNIFSAFICMRMAEMYIGKYEVGIITPYSKQSRLIVSMLRDMQERDERWKKVSCATVHQFQGSEKPIIIYDAVDCYRMTHPGTLLTSQKNDTADRLFNVAVTRTKGKFVLVANLDYMLRKNISEKLMFTKALRKMDYSETLIKGEDLLEELMQQRFEKPIISVSNREESFERFLEDISGAENSIQIDIPDAICDYGDATERLISILDECETKNIDVEIRIATDISTPSGLTKFVKRIGYIVNPITIIDKKTVWFGQPLFAGDFISEGDIIDTEVFTCIRFEGKYTSRMLQALLEV